MDRKDSCLDLVFCSWIKGGARTGHASRRNRPWLAPLGVLLAVLNCGALLYVDVNHPLAQDSAADAGTEAKPFKSLAKAAAVVRPGDTVYVKAGTYTSTAPRNYRGVLEIDKSGTAAEPITFRAYPGHRVVLDAQGLQYHAIRLGNPFLASSQSAHVVVEGFHCTRGYGDGIYVLKPDHVTIRNCEIYRNNQNWEMYGRVSFSPGINVVAGQHCTIEDCRIYNNGGGIGFVELVQTSLDPVGSSYCTVRNNFIYGNSNSGNYGNSSGVAMRFGQFSLIEGNIIYDHPDAAINGLGNLHNHFIGNACLNSWQYPGNREGIKFCVRGGGGNLVAFNLAAFNAGRGFDATDGIGDVFLNNTVYRNDAWGLLMEGRCTFAWNNIAYLNYVTNSAGRKDLLVGGYGALHASSDYNLFGDEANLPLVSPYKLLQPHSINLNPQFLDPDLPLPRLHPRQILHPEQLFSDVDGDGHVTVDEARMTLANRYTLGPAAPARSAGTTLAAAQAALTVGVPDIIQAAQARIVQLSTSTASQSRQAIARWNRLIGYLQAPDHGGIDDLTGMADFAGRPVEMHLPLHLGAIQDP